MNPTLYQAPVAKKQSFFNRKWVFFGIGIIVAILIGVILLNLAGRGGVDEDYARVVAREEALADIIHAGSGEISNVDLNKINTDADIFVSSDIVSLSTGLSRVSSVGIPKNIALVESADDYSTDLDQAKLQNRYDIVYKDLLQTKVDSQMALLKNVYSQLGQSTARDAIKRAYNNLQSIQTALTALSLS